MMSNEKLISLITCALVLLVSTNSVGANHVIKLTDSNFEHTTQASTGQTTGKWFINFHSTSCGHCLNLAPIWTTLSEELKSMEYENSSSGILIGSVDVQENPLLAERFHIQGLPTLLFFAEGHMFEYPVGAARSVDEFLKFALDDGTGKGGYANVELKSVPKGPGGMLKLVADLRKNVYDIDLLRFLLDDVEHILHLRKNAAVLLLVAGFLVGFFVASLLGLKSKHSAAMIRVGKLVDKDKKDK